jgi:RNA polymerase sigma-70 factor (ECF subfamily)
VESDAQLLQAWGAGDEPSGRVLVGRYLSRLYVFFRNKCPVDCEELVQRTFLACLEKLPELRASASFRSFLFGIARIELLRSYRARAVDQGRVDFSEHSVFEIDPTPSAILAKKEEQALLLDALRRIPADFQILLELHYWEKLTTAEVANVLGVPQGTIKTRLRRARELLSDSIESLAGDRKELHRSTIDGFEHWVEDVRALIANSKPASGRN